jgi:head-tail adaptor
VGNLLAEGATWLQETQADNAGVDATYRRGPLAVAVTAVLGSSVEVPYGSSPFPTVVKTAYVARAGLTFDELALDEPAIDDTLEWWDADGTTLRILTLGPWGPDRAPARLEDDGITYRLYGRETAGIQVGLAARKVTTVALEKPKASPTRNAYGEIARGQYDQVGDDIVAELQPESAGEQTDAGKLGQVSKFRAFVNTTAAVAASWRLRIKSGPWDGKILNVEAVSPVPGIANELMLLGRMVGG